MMVFGSLRDETSVEVKIYGRRIFTVDIKQYVIILLPLFKRIPEVIRMT